MTRDLATALEFFDKNIGAVRRDDVVPKGFVTAKQITLARGLAASSTFHVKSQWDQLVELGLADRRILKIGRYRTAYYKGKK